MATLDRDRDNEGRARNARPRDGLGRPLPYGNTGVDRQPEGVLRPPEATIREAQQLLDAGKPFHAHEVFEDAWKAAADGEGQVWRAMAQLAVGLTHAARGNRSGARTLLDRGVDTLRPFLRQPPHDLDVSGIIRWAQDLNIDTVEGAPARYAPRLSASAEQWPGRRGR